MDKIQLKAPMPYWACPYCGKSVGTLGNLLSQFFGTGMHGCDSSNVVSPQDRQLSRSAFNDSLHHALRKYWPDVTRAEAVTWLRGYIDTPHGDDGYDWSRGAAEEIALEYVKEYGEQS